MHIMKANKLISNLNPNNLSRVCISSSKLGRKLSKCHKYSSAFDPYWTLHHQTVTRDQQEAFREVWDNDIGSFKKDLTKEEYELFQRKVNETASIDDFEGLMKGLWGPDRHAFVRQTRTFKYANETVLNGIKESKNPHECGVSLILGDDEKFNEFLLESKLKSNDKEGLLTDLIYAELRYLCACIAFDYFGGPTITIAFGHRKKYHYDMPNPIGRSAYWMNCIYDRCDPIELVFLSAVNAIKDNKPISTNYFKELLDGLEHNAFKEEEWRPYAKGCVEYDKTLFLDNFDRCFNKFQSDPGTTKLQIRYATDWERFRI